MCVLKHFSVDVDEAAAGFSHCASCYYICHIPRNISSAQICKAVRYDVYL